MNVKTVLPLIACMALLPHAPGASAQYTARPQSGSAQASWGSTAGLGLAFVTYLGGDSLLMSADQEEWVALSPHLSLRVGDRVWVQDGANAEIRFPLGATAWLNYQSELDITRLESGSRGDTIQLALVSGEGAFDLKGFARAGSVLQVDLPTASIRAARAARFRVNTLPDGTAQIGVISGSVVLETPDGLTDVTRGQMAEVQPDRRVILDFLPPNDEWDNWVRSRAAVYDRPAASLRYLPADLSSYAHEFDNAGRWQNVATYGSVWVPTVEQGWSPYSNGRWVWQVNDYVWLSFDPWYAPFHYGRWSWGASVGWFWIAPSAKAYWSPGYVGWSVSDNEVSWVPLGRNETYYGYGNYGPGNVNVTNRTRVNVSTVYVNSKVSNGIVAVRKDNFLRGRIVDERVVSQKNQFQKNSPGGSIVIGRPPVREIAPIRESMRPQPAVVIKRQSLPPARLGNQSKIIKARVAATTRERSAFTPGSKPAVLKNIQKEKEFEEWKPTRKAAAASRAGSPSAATVNSGRAVVKQSSAPAVTKEVQPPAGKRAFKRVPEPRDDEQESNSSSGEQKGGGIGVGKKK